MIYVARSCSFNKPDIIRKPTLFQYFGLIVYANPCSRRQKPVAIHENSPLAVKYLFGVSAVRHVKVFQFFNCVGIYGKTQRTKRLDVVSVWRPVHAEQKMLDVVYRCFLGQSFPR